MIVIENGISSAYPGRTAVWQILNENDSLEFYYAPSFNSTVDSALVTIDPDN
jgi:hypothetical protein